VLYTFRMVYSRSRGFIFVHIFKNAGTSITEALKPYALSKFERFINSWAQRFRVRPLFNPFPAPGHATAAQIKDTLGSREWSRCFSFAIVRNPWDWQTSLYEYTRKTPEHFQHAQVAAMQSFEEYLEWRCNEDVMLQSEFLTDLSGEVMVSYVGRFESLHESWKTIQQHTGVPCEIPRLNTSRAADYRSYYRPPLVDLVARTFEQDIKRFGYTF